LIGIGHPRGNRIALERIYGKLDPQRRKQCRSLVAQGDNRGIALQYAARGLCAHHPTALMQQSPHIGVESKLHARTLKPGGQCLAENVAITRGIGRQMKAARDPGGGVSQGRLDRQRIAPVQHTVANAEFPQCAGGNIAIPALRYGLEQLQHAARMKIERDRRLGHELLQASETVVSHALHAQFVDAKPRRIAFHQPSPGPTEPFKFGPKRKAHRGIGLQRHLQYLDRHSRRGPWRRKARAQTARIAEAGFHSRRRVAFHNFDVMAFAAEIVGRCGADYAGSEDENFHGRGCLGRS
jgi:hypothetical protein